MWHHALLARGQAAPGRARARPPLVALVLVIAMSVVATFGLRVVFDVFAAAGATTGELARVLGLALTAAFAALVLFDLDAAAATLLVDRDLSLLRRAPVSTRAIVGLKLIDALPRTGVPLATLAVPALVAFALSCPLPPAAWLLIPVLVVLLWILAMGAGVAVVLPLLAAAPPRRAREALSLVATLTLTLVWLFNALALPRLAEFDRDVLDQARAMLERPGWLIALSPGSHAALAVRALHERDVRTLAGELGLLVGLAAAACGLALAAAAAILPRVLERVSAPSLHEAVAMPRVRSGDPPRGLVRAVFLRDLRLFTRDWTMLADVLTAAVLWTLLPWISRIALHAGDAPLARAMISTLAVGLGYEIAARALPLERRGIQWMSLAPVAPRRWLLAKLATVWALAAPLVALAAITLSGVFHLTGSARVGLLAVGISALALSTGVGLWTGSTFGDFHWTYPRAMLTTPGRLVAAGLMIAQIVFWLGFGIASGVAEDLGLRRALEWGPVAAAPALALIPLGLTWARIARRGSWS